MGLNYLSILVAIGNDIVQFVKGDFLTLSESSLNIVIKPKELQDMIRRKSYTLFLGLAYTLTNKGFPH